MDYRDNPLPQTRGGQCWTPIRGQLCTPIDRHETIQARIDFPPGSLAPRHTHPGEEIIYVLAGPLQYQVAGADWQSFNTGDVPFISAGTVHAARNTGTAPATELATYVVEKGKPLIVLAL